MTELPVFYCIACLAFGDPMILVSDEPSLDVGAVAATTFTFATEAPLGIAATDGFALQEGRVLVSGHITDWLAGYAGLGFTDRGIGQIEAYGDVMPVDGLVIRAGRWLQNTGSLSRRHVETGRFVDAPIHTARFLSPDGFYDTGLGVAYDIPIPKVPITLAAAILSGTQGASFSAPAAAGEGGELLDRLTYMVRLQLDPGRLFDQHLGVGFFFATGLNSTGPGNRTDLIGFDVGSRFDLGSDVALEVDIEFLMRRYSIPLALNVTGGLAADAVVTWKGVVGGLRFDLVGVPKPETEESAWRLSALAGYAVNDYVSFNAQYSARTDNLEGNTGHELTLQAIIGGRRRLGGGGETRIIKEVIIKERIIRERDPDAPARLQPKEMLPRHRPVPQPEKAPESRVPADWYKASQQDLSTSKRLAEQDAHGLSVFHAQQAAQKALVAVALRRRLVVPAQDRSCVGVVELLQAAGHTVPAEVASFARSLDRNYTISRYPSELGGAPSRYYDATTSAGGQSQAETIISWAGMHLRGPIAPEPEPVPAPQP